MIKSLTYTGFAVSGLLLVLTFITAKTYAQLAIAVILYPLLAFFALKLFPKTNHHPQAPAIHVQPSQIQKTTTQPREHVETVDLDKRTFLKLLGTAGLSFFVFSLLGRKVENMLFGDQSAKALPIQQTPENGVSSTSLQTTEGYKISEIDEGPTTYYGFINKNGGWLIMKEEIDSTSFRYAKGESDFPVNWAKKGILKYDYYHNLF